MHEENEVPILRVRLDSEGQETTRMSSLQKLPQTKMKITNPTTIKLLKAVRKQILAEPDQFDVVAKKVF